MHKNMKRAYLVLAIVFVAFSVIVFAIPFTKNAVFWMSYRFFVIATGVQGYAIYLAFSAKGSRNSKLYGFPVARIGFIYWIVQLIVSLVFMLLSNLVPTWVPLVIDIIALGAAGIGLISTDAMREEIQRQDTQLKKDVSSMRSMQSMSRLLVTQCEDAALQSKLRQLSEALQYSDPVSNNAIASIESNLTELLNELQKAVVEQEYSAATALCTKAMDVLAERNRLCKLNKNN